MNPFIFNLYSEYRSVLYSYLSIQFLKFYLLQHVKPGLHEKAYLICIFLKNVSFVFVLLFVIFLILKIEKNCLPLLQKTASHVC